MTAALEKSEEATPRHRSRIPDSAASRRSLRHEAFSFEGEYLVPFEELSELVPNSEFLQKGLRAVFLCPDLKSRPAAAF